MSLGTHWFEVFGHGNAAAFDQMGWQYFVRGVFDFFYVGYWDEWTTFQGATGMTYETDGGPEFNKRRDDGTITDDHDYREIARRAGKKPRRVR